MEEIKSYLLEFIWSAKDVSEFEQWLYQQDPVECTKLLGNESYTELISFNYTKISPEQLKKFIKTLLSDGLIQEFEQEFEKRKSGLIRGICVKQTALDYYAKENRDWKVEIGKNYNFLTIQLGIKRGNHSALLKYIDSSNFFQPSGFVPMELFELDLTNIPDSYSRVLNEENETTIELEAFSYTKYEATQYSFWEDFYNDDPKALKTYFETLEKFGIRNDC
ncbi:hypothetical protein [Croceimicrobium hydrocarbonivorans]|uniref:Uncharacterized protein n=1 Tax=Croceimicrobium hydrocarbonivorans TaxID=2761580 RepID=A0A7H0VHF3_9FLAO|nr:hypothetical protein [Croceimicrobium hydrocarbonivorans]QNR25151.1 hypothetical protein H4K34_04750 [Croceimicrobium hydrocarbonivorans]